MPNFFLIFCISFIFYCGQPHHPHRFSPSAPSVGICISTYLYICLGLGLCPTLYINSMIKQKNQKTDNFFSYFFYCGQYLHCKNTFLFWEKQIIIKHFLLLSIIFLWSFNSFIYTRTHTRKYKFFFNFPNTNNARDIHGYH